VLLSLLKAHQPRWADRFHLQRIGLFGSVARGDATVHLKRELEALLQRPVDLVRLRERMTA